MGHRDILSRQRLLCQRRQEPWHLIDFQLVIDSDVSQRTARHRRIRGFGGGLYDCNATPIFDRPEASGTVIEHPGQHDADHTGTGIVCRRPEEYVDRWTRMTLAGAFSIDAIASPQASDDGQAQPRRCARAVVSRPPPLSASATTWLFAGWAAGKPHSPAMYAGRSASMPAGPWAGRSPDGTTPAARPWKPR